MPGGRVRHEGAGDCLGGPRQRAPNAPIRGSHRWSFHRHSGDGPACRGLLLFRVRVPGVLGEFFVFRFLGFAGERGEREDRARKEREQREKRHGKGKTRKRKGDEEEGKGSHCFLPSPSFLSSPPPPQKRRDRASPGSKSPTSSTPSSRTASTSPWRPRTGRSTSSRISTRRPRGRRSPTTRSRCRSGTPRTT